MHIYVQVNEDERCAYIVNEEEMCAYIGTKVDEEEEKLNGLEQMKKRRS